MFIIHLNVLYNLRTIKFRLVQPIRMNYAENDCQFSDDRYTISMHHQFFSEQAIQNFYEMKCNNLIISVLENSLDFLFLLSSYLNQLLIIT